VQVDEPKIAALQTKYAAWLKPANAVATKQ
jgi:hypothetical protein